MQPNFITAEQAQVKKIYSRFKALRCKGYIIIWPIARDKNIKLSSNVI